MKKPLGAIIRSIEFSHEEKIRISRSILDKSGLPYEALQKKYSQINRNDFWKGAYKSFSVTGFRVGHALGKEMVLTRALESLKNKGPEDNLFWPLYRNSIIVYIYSELKELDKLLGEEESLFNSENLTDQIFKKIKEKSLVYEVPINQVKELYEIWGFERTSKFEEIINNEIVSMEMIEQLVKKESVTIKTALDRVAEDTSSSIKQLKTEIVTDIRSIQNQVTSGLEKSEESIEELRIEFQNAISTVFNKKVSELNEVLKKNEKIVDSKKNVSSENINVLQDKINSLQKRIVNLETASHKVDPLVLHHKRQNKNVDNKSVVDMIASWTSKLNSYGFKCRKKETPLALLTILNRSKIIYCENWKMLKLLLDDFQDLEVKLVSASPLWITPNDWKEEFSFVLNTDHERILVISDFDIPIQESYLLPKLIEFYESDQHLKSKIILIPSENSDKVSYRIFEVASVLSLSSVLINELENFESINPLDKLLTRASIDFFNFNFSSNISFEDDLKTIVSKKNVGLPVRLTQHFANCSLGLQQIYSNKNSIRIALNLCILPWINGKHGNGVSRIVDESIKFFIEEV